MATITTDTFLDGGTARTAGEVWTLNGATLTIRTDTRWHANAPASMTGSLGNVTVSTSIGGGILIDGTAVRWLPFTGGSGNVPAIGTTVSQGGTSGYLLGVWSSLQSAPNAVGSAMPVTGFLKFREVAGTFSAGLLTGITATASSADVQGWIEIVLDANAGLTGFELGTGVQVKGGWFYLDSTNGTRGQQIQLPTNGGGAATYWPAVQIETAAGSGVFEWFPTATSASTWNTANTATDVRAKFVQTMDNGIIRIGSDGTNNVGYLPPAGCRVRIPSVIGRSVATATRATNAAPGGVTRGRVLGLNYNIDGLITDWSITGANVANLKLKKFAGDNAVSFTNNKTPIEIDDVCFGGYTGSATTLFTLDTITGGTVSNVKAVSLGYILGSARYATCAEITFSNTEYIINKARTSTLYTLSLVGVSNSTFNGIKLKGAGANLQAVVDSTMTNIDYIDRVEGDTTTVGAASIVNLASTVNLTISDVTFGEKGLIDNVQPYGTLINFATSVPNTGLKVRNFGTATSPLSSGTNASLYPPTIFSIQPGDNNVRFQRIFLSNLRTALFAGSASNMRGLLVEDVGAYSGTTNMNQYQGRNAVFRKVRVGSLGTGLPPAANVGTHWQDLFTSETTGAIRWFGESPTPQTADKNYLQVTPTSGTGYISGSTAISLDTLGDVAYSESPWMFLGHTGFQNAAPVVSGAATGLVISYQLNTGSGYSGVWKVANGANLSAETISPSGFSMKIKIEQTTTTNTATLLSSIAFLTTTTLAAQAANQYPLDVVTLTLEGLKPGSEVRAYVGTNPATAVEIGGTESSADTFSFTHTSSGQQGYIMIFAMGYQPIMIPRTYATSDSSLLIQQVIDRNYLNP